MTVGETLLKITDYPFAYSFTFIILAFSGINLYSKDAYPYLAAAGFVGTFLAILDPFGRIIKYSIIIFEKLRMRWIRNKDGEEWIYVQSAFHTRQIEVEKDKILSMFYFSLIVAISINFINSSNSAIHHLAFIFDLNPTCNLDCQKTLTIFTLNIIEFTVIGVMTWNAKRLGEKANIVATYLSCITSPKTPAQPIENISRFIESGDWKTAEYWQKRIRDDIKHNRGDKDVIMKGIEKGYRLLFKESRNIENRCNEVVSGGSYPYLNIDEWRKIESESDYVFLKDKLLLQRIEKFYGEVQSYNRLLGVCSTKVNEIILGRASEEFGKKIKRIEYLTNGASGESYFRLVDCAILGVSPKEKYQGSPKYADFDYFDDRRGENVNYKTTGAELNKFDTMWEKVIDDVKKNENVIKIKESFQKIQQENSELKQKYFEKIVEELDL